MSQKSIHFKEPENTGSQQIQAPNKVQSQYLSIYSKGMSKIATVDSMIIRDKLAENGIIIVDKFYENVSPKLIQTNLDSAVVEVSLGNFQMLISIYRVGLKECDVLEKGYLDSGSYASVSIVNVNGECYACKSIPIKNVGDLTSLTQIYEEYILTKIAGVLEIGPRIMPVFAYDIVCFSDSAVLIMELCRTDFPMCSSTIQHDLQVGLKILHSLRICHGDIKLKNIAYSYLSEKFIFIDFGLSIAVKQQIGFKTLTFYFGSYRFVSPEMKRIYHTKGHSYVDLYYNDFHALECLFSKSASIASCMTPQEKIDIQQVDCSIAAVFAIKYLIFTGKVDWALEEMLKTKNMGKTVVKLFIEEFYIRRREYCHNKDKQEIFNALKFQMQKSPHNLIDDILSVYFQKFYNDELECCFISLNALESELPLQIIWKNSYWMNEITLFLQANLTTDLGWSKKQFTLREQLICRIFDYIGHACPYKELNLSFLFKFRAVLAQLYEYYKQKKHIRFLESVRHMQIKIDDLSGQYKTQAALLQLYTEAGRSRDELTIKKIEFLLFRKMVSYSQFIKIEDMFRFDAETQVIFLQFNRDQPTNLQLLFKSLLAAEVIQTEQIQQQFDQCLSDQIDEERITEITDLKLFYQSFLSPVSLVESISRDVKNKSMKVILEKLFCYYRIGTYDTLTYFKHDLYLSHVKGYFEMLKNFEEMSNSEVQETVDEYFEIYFRHLQILPLAEDFINGILHSKNGLIGFVAFVKKYISVYRPAACETETYATQNIRIIGRALAQVFLFQKRFKTFDELPSLCRIFYQCMAEVRHAQIPFYFQVLLKFNEILVNYFEKKQQPAVKLLALIKEIGADQSVLNYSFHLIIVTAGYIWALSKNTHDEIQDLFILLSQTCEKHKDFTAFSEIRQNLRYLQQIFHKRDLCKREFEFLQTITLTKDKYKSNSFSVICLKIHKPYHYFVTSYTPEKLLQIAAIICQSSSKVVTERYHIASLYIEIYLKVESSLTDQQKKKFLTIIIFGLPKVLWVPQKNLILPIIYKKSMKIFGCKSQRKQMILLKIMSKYKEQRPLKRIHLIRDSHFKGKQICLKTQQVFDKKMKVYYKFAQGPES